MKKGIRERMLAGGEAGYPVVGVRVTLVDGKHHSNDSDNRSFERAGSKAFQEAFQRCSPVLLEPVLEVEVTCPLECTGAVIGDLSARRGKVLGLEPQQGQQRIRARAPVTEMTRYGVKLESLTSGRGMVSSTPAGYEPAPAALAREVLAARRGGTDD